MSFLSAAWEQVYGLLVEDGQIAIGTLAAFIACGAISVLAGNLGSDSLRNSARNRTSCRRTNSLYKSRHTATMNPVRSGGGDNRRNVWFRERVFSVRNVR